MRGLQINAAIVLQRQTKSRLLLPSSYCFRQDSLLWHGGVALHLACCYLGGCISILLAEDRVQAS